MSNVPSPNRVLLSAAGSGKTTLLVRQALERPLRRIAIVTYTLENLEEIRRSFEMHAGAVPRMSRCAAGMDFCCASASARTRLRFALSLGSRRSCSSTGAPTTAPHAHKSRDTIWPATECTPIGRPTYAVRCDELTQGQVMARLADMYDELYIDEVRTSPATTWTWSSGC